MTITQKLLTDALSLLIALISRQNVSFIETGVDFNRENTHPYNGGLDLIWVKTQEVFSPSQTMLMKVDERRSLYDVSLHGPVWSTAIALSDGLFMYTVI